MPHLLLPLSDASPCPFRGQMQRHPRSQEYFHFDSYSDSEIYSISHLPHHISDNAPYIQKRKTDNLSCCLLWVSCLVLFHASLISPVNPVKFTVTLSQRPVFSGSPDPIYLIHTIGQRREAFPGYNHIIIIGFLNLPGKIIGSDKLISLINKHDTVPHAGQLLPPQRRAHKPL